ncbi:hypothetical protein ASE90_11575 [Sphingomonas sp. Leaf67]|uniref:hypothetical protein n=1 Tax=Sphingomonas sp. Leaf67 TaxID=1736230 RepID=UPI00071351C3|nr:hypothetical protein [Sphingomonas sp. Leaf67]KQN82304.1 hypothetical protein ASE90_11575 [Sphingomonas sp. Leaf67]
MLVILIAAIYAVVTSPDDMTWARRHAGVRTEVPTWQVQLVALPPLLFVSGLLLWWLGKSILRAYRENRDGACADAGSGMDAALLVPGEVIWWQGKQGWRSLTSTRLTVLGLFAVGLTGILLMLWSVGTGDVHPWLRTFWFVFVLFVFSGPLGMAILHGPEAMQQLWYDSFGTMAVTDRRVIWIAPSNGFVYREIAGGDLVEAGLVEGNDARGWIALVERRGTDNVNEIDARGVPEPMAALSALGSLMRQGTVATP